MTMFFSAIDGDCIHDDVRPNGYYTEPEWNQFLMKPVRPIIRKNEYARLIQLRLDTFAREKTYDDIGAAMRASLTTKFKDDGDVATKAYEDTWEASFQYQAQVESGELSIFEAFAKFPVLEWPVP